MASRAERRGAVDNDERVQRLPGHYCPWKAYGGKAALRAIKKAPPAKTSGATQYLSLPRLANRVCWTLTNPQNLYELLTFVLNRLLGFP
jgi:hypothetical protein